MRSKTCHCAIGKISCSTIRPEVSQNYKISFSGFCGRLKNISIGPVTAADIEFFSESAKWQLYQSLCPTTRPIHYSTTTTGLWSPVIDQKQFQIFPSHGRGGSYPHLFIHNDPFFHNKTSLSYFVNVTKRWKWMSLKWKTIHETDESNFSFSEIGFKFNLAWGIKKIWIKKIDNKFKIDNLQHFVAFIILQLIVDQVPTATDEF